MNAQGAGNRAHLDGDERVAKVHTATRRQGRIRGAGDKTLRDAGSRATKAFHPALSMCDLLMCDLLWSGESHPIGEPR